MILNQPDLSEPRIFINDTDSQEIELQELKDQVEILAEELQKLKNELKEVKKQVTHSKLIEDWTILSKQPTIFDQTLNQDNFKWGVQCAPIFQINQTKPENYNIINICTDDAYTISVSNSDSFISVVDSQLHVNGTLPPEVKF